MRSGPTGIARRVAFASAWLFPAAAAARQVAAPAQPAADLGAEGSPLLDLTVMLIAFLLAVGLAWLGGRWLMRRMYGPGSWGGGRVRVVERIPLEPRRTLYLVEAGSKLLLLGATDHDIRVLGEFASSDLPRPPAPERRSFLDALRKGSGGTKAT